jgi:NAD(P)H-flavin reductase
LLTGEPPLSVRSYRFALPSPTSILGLPIGQHVSIRANCTQSDGTTTDIQRSYTPISSDHTPGHFDLLIKSYPTGNISRHLASLAVGQTINVRGPKGAFVYTPNMVRHFGMIAGGTGITPMLQIVRAVIRGRPTGDVTQIDLIFANVTPDDILLKEDLDALAQEDKAFRVHYVLDKPPQGWTGGQGYVNADMITVSVPPSFCRALSHSPFPYTYSLSRPLPSALEHRKLNIPAEMAPQAGPRRQALALRASAYDQRTEEDGGHPGLREGAGRQQAARPGLRLLRTARNARREHFCRWSVYR